jgi:mannose/cellobiose epimerase-like protein (N-acyl-D-glucosamine 2-epimerase family)
LLAHSKGYRIGEIECLAQLNAVNQFLIDQFYDSEVGIFADERSSDLSVLSDYRGQKANMHLCEAYITAYEATKNEKFLTLAQGQAKRFVVDFAALADGLIWEHYHAD